MNPSCRYTSNRRLRQRQRAIACAAGLWLTLLLGWQNSARLGAQSGTQAHLQQFDQLAVHDVARDAGLKGSVFDDIGFDLSNHLWVRIGRSAVGRLDEEGWTFYDHESGLPKDGIDRLVIMEDGTPWVVAGGTLYTLAETTFRPSQLLKASGTQNQLDIFKDDLGRIYLLHRDTNGAWDCALLRLVSLSTERIQLPDHQSPPLYLHFTENGTFALYPEALYLLKNNTPPQIIAKPAEHFEFSQAVLHPPQSIHVLERHTKQAVFRLHGRIWHENNSGYTVRDLDFLAEPKLGFRRNRTTTLTGLTTEGFRVHYLDPSLNLRQASPPLPYTSTQITKTGENRSGVFWLAGHQMLTAITPPEQTHLRVASKDPIVHAHDTDFAWFKSGYGVISSAGVEVTGNLVQLSQNRPWIARGDGLLTPLAKSSHKPWSPPEPTLHWKISDRGKKVLAIHQNEGQLRIVDADAPSQVSTLTVDPNARIHQVQFSGGYHWFLLENSGALTVVRWDAVLEEAHSAAPIPLSSQPPLAGPLNFMVLDKSVYVWNGTSLFKAGERLAEWEQVLPDNHHALAPIFIGETSIWLPHRSPTQTAVTRIEQSGHETRTTDFEGWHLSALDNQNRLLWIHQDRNLIGRSLFENRAVINPISIDPYITHTSEILPTTGNTFFLNVRHPRDFRSFALQYRGFDSAPATRIEIFTELRKGRGAEVIALVSSQQWQPGVASQPGIQYAWRLNDEPWQPFRNYPENRINLGFLPEGNHQLVVRARTQDFHERPLFVRESFKITPPPIQTTSWFNSLVISIIVLVFSLAFIAGQKAFVAQRMNRILKMEVEARQQAQIDLMDINEDLEKRVKRRTQELVFANESLKKQVEERKVTEARLQETHHALVSSSRQAGMAEIATGVLHNVGNVLNSLNISLEMIRTRAGRDKHYQGLEKLAQLLENNRNTPDFLQNDPKGQKVPEYVNRLAETLRMATSENDAFLTEMSKKVEHIKEIIAAQQDYAKVAGVVESFDVEEAITQMLKLNERSLAADNVEIRLKAAQGLTVQGERPKVQQIILNLIQNAQWACRENHDIPGRISVTSYLINPDTVAIDIKDNGVGISKEHLKKIFFHGFTTRKDGHGFGLHTAITMAQEMQGKLEAFSEGHNQGALFRLTLPLDIKEGAKNLKQWTEKPGADVAQMASIHATSSPA